MSRWRRENFDVENVKDGKVNGRWTRNTLNSSALTFKGLKSGVLSTEIFNPISQK